MIEKNINFIKNNSLILFEKISQLKENSSYNFFNTGNGYSLTVNGKPITSKVNPIKEAQKKVEAYKLDGFDAVVFLGLGLGYELVELLKKDIKIPIIVIEKDVNIFYYFLKIFDLEDIIKKNLIEIIFPEDPSTITETLKLYNIEKPFIVVNRQLFEIYKDYYQSALDSINKYVETRIINKATLIRFEKLWLKNVLVNMGYYLYFKGVNSLYDKFKDTPALIIGGGPSLNRCIDKIKKVKDNVFIISVNTSLAYLLDNGIVPDFVVTVDPQDKIYKYFIPVLNKKELPILIAEPTITPKIVRKYPRILFSQIEFAKDFVLSFSKDRGVLETGGSVVTTAFSFARKIGANPIMFIGVDMSYTTDTLHFKGSELEKDWIFNSNKNKTIESLNYFFMRKFKLIEKEGFHGSVKTDIKFMTYANWLEENFKLYKDKIRIINFSEGLLFKYIENRAIDDISDICAEYTKDKHYLIDTVNSEYNKEANLFIGKINYYENEINYIKKILENGIIIAERLYNKIKNGKRDLNELKELDKIDKKIMESESKTILGLSIQKAIYEIEEEKVVLTNEERENKELGVIKKSLYLYRSILESCEYTLNQIKKSLSIINRINT
ncbi:MAG TPA: DUF115 domain-containing protein [Spirochaetota bacterium]|nr:DUF115 domain-containing protein [Spirochaetota bacterium]HOM38448.1 DUF115 domain-containing protein [Spirochaetota bacterium]HPQ48988.1 DUF115 domain-containing protein [Spirochaetota bacterium]